jgi:hypothetical protein
MSVAADSTACVDRCLIPTFLARKTDRGHEGTWLREQNWPINFVAGLPRVGRLLGSIHYPSLRPLRSRGAARLLTLLLRRVAVAGDLAKCVYGGFNFFFLALPL